MGTFGFPRPKAKSSPRPICVAAGEMIVLARYLGALRLMGELVKLRIEDFLIDPDSSGILKSAARRRAFSWQIGAFQAP
jgi:hypothetical protein